MAGLVVSPRGMSTYSLISASIYGVLTVLSGALDTKMKKTDMVSATELITVWQMIGTINIGTNKYMK